MDVLLNYVKGGLGPAEGSDMAALLAVVTVRCTLAFAVLGRAKSAVVFGCGLVCSNWLGVWFAQKPRTR